MEEEECGATHVNQKIAWLQVAVPDIRRVNVLQRTEDLRSKDKPTGHQMYIRRHITTWKTRQYHRALGGGCRAGYLDGRAARHVHAPGT